MAVIAPLLAFIGRQVGRIVQVVFGWATVMLFGRQPQSKQLLLAGVSLGSVLWVVALIGVVLPNIGTLLIAAIPAPDFIDETWIRLAMLGLAVLLPIGVGVGGLFLIHRDDRPSGGRAVVQVLRGYPYAAVLATVLLFLVVVAPFFKLRSIVKRWESTHIPIVTQPGRYGAVAGKLEEAIDAAGLDLERTRAPRVLELPSRLLAAVGGATVRRLVPDQLIMLRAPVLEITVHPADVAVTGTKQAVARARAAVASRLTETDAYLTTTAEAQQVEDELRAVRRGELRDAGTALRALDTRLASLVVPYEEWEILYRQRLQVERDLLRAQAGRGGNGLVGQLARVIDEIVGRG